MSKQNELIEKLKLPFGCRFPFELKKIEIEDPEYVISNPDGTEKIIKGSSLFEGLEDSMFSLNVQLEQGVKLNEVTFSDPHQFDQQRVENAVDAYLNSLNIKND